MDYKMRLLPWVVNDLCYLCKMNDHIIIGLIWIGIKDNHVEAEFIE